MRVLCLKTYTADTEKTWRSLACLGHECTVMPYDDRPHDRHGEFVEQAAAIRPDVIVYIGAIEKYHGRPVLSSDVLCRLREVAPTIHVCGDGSDEPWWDLLIEYHRRGCFAAQVSIDGNFETPIHDFPNGLVKLTPTDPSLFTPRPWPERETGVGMAGGRGHGERAALLDAFLGRPGFRWLDSAAGASYGQMCGFLSGCRLVLNSPMNGSGTGEHVKGRVVEAGWAGACLLERANPVTAGWFQAGEYLEYADAADALAKAEWAAEHQADAAAMAQKLRARVEAEHHPRVFWGDVFKIAGLLNFCNA